MTNRRISPFQLRGEPDPGRHGRGNSLMVLQFGPRYSRTPQDDTTVLSVFHRTTGAPVSALLERADLTALALWLPQPAPGPGRTDADFLPKPDRTGDYGHAVQSNAVQFDLHSGQTTALFTKYNGSSAAVLVVAIRWNGSGRSWGIALTGPQVRDMAIWLNRIDTQGWEGWKSGLVAGEEGAP
jgi:hypothetical protein